MTSPHHLPVPAPASARYPEPAPAFQPPHGQSSSSPAILISNGRQPVAGLRTFAHQETEAACTEKVCHGSSSWKRKGRGVTPVPIRNWIAPHGVYPLRVLRLLPKRFGCPDRQPPGRNASIEIADVRPFHMRRFLQPRRTLARFRTARGQRKQSFQRRVAGRSCAVSPRSRQGSARVHPARRSSGSPLQHASPPS